MLRLASYDVVFQEVPGEVTLALNISGCPNGCPGCHSPHLRADTGEPLDEELLHCLLDRYGGTVTCVCFMGGDGEPHEVERLAKLAKALTGGRLKAAWYSGRGRLPEGFDGGCLDYLKLGPYIERLGGLRSPATNQRFYRRAAAGENAPIPQEGPARTVGVTEAPEAAHTEAPAAATTEAPTAAHVEAPEAAHTEAPTATMEGSQSPVEKPDGFTDITSVFR